MTLILSVASIHQEDSDRRVARARREMQLRDFSASTQALYLAAMAGFGEATIIGHRTRSTEATWTIADITGLSDGRRPPVGG